LAEAAKAIWNGEPVNSRTTTPILQLPVAGGAVPPGAFDDPWVAEELEQPDRTMLATNNSENATRMCFNSISSLSEATSRTT